MNGEDLLQWYDRVKSHLLTRIVRSSFDAFGLGSRIVAPLRLHGAARIRVGARVFFGSGCWLNCVSTATNSESPVLLSIGDDVSISGGCTLSAALNVTIGDSVLIARGVYISDHDHRRKDGQTLHRDVGETAAVAIGEGVWLGQSCCVLRGVSIGAGAVIGANSVVTHDVPPGGVAVGAPARLLKVFEQ